VIDHVLKDTLSCGSSYCRKAVYQGLRVDCTAMWVAKLRTRVFPKWKASRTTIGELMNQLFKCSNAIWVTGTETWLHRLLHYEIPITQREAIQAVKSKLIERKLHTDGCAIDCFKQVNLIN
ncbi:putative transposable element encoded protein, partial [Trachipleistophora hominis]